jgi:hypothetical protein
LKSQCIAITFGYDAKIAQQTRDVTHRRSSRGFGFRLRKPFPRHECCGNLDCNSSFQASGRRARRLLIRGRLRWDKLENRQCPFRRINSASWENRGYPRSVCRGSEKNYPTCPRESLHSYHISLSIHETATKRISSAVLPHIPSGK